MPGDMKFEESSLKGYLVKNLEPLTEADPVILAEYVVALLKKDKPTKELQQLCTDNLVDFLGHGTKAFITKLFQALEDGSITRSVDPFVNVKKSEASPTIPVDLGEQKSSSIKEDNHSTSSGPVSDPEDIEISDDDDDDRNHKHRRRDTRSESLDKDGQGQILRRPNRKRNKPYDNGQSFFESNPQSNELQREYNPSMERDLSSKFERQRLGMVPLFRAPVDLSQRARMSQTFRSEPGPRLDLSTSLGRSSVGRGRGRGTGPWNPHDSRFSPLDSIDFMTQMASQGAPHPSLFVGTRLPSAASTQSPSWGAFGFIPGMPNGCLDPLHPLGLQGTLRPTMNPSMNLSIPRQRCRDFEEQGFCLRGDMCPMEHGVNRIVVEDVQSLSQFNLPVSIPSTRASGIQAGTGPFAPISASSSLLTISKSLPGKTSKSGVGDDGLGLSGVLSVSGARGEPDVYDPDQPLWNNDRPQTSAALLGIPSPRIVDTVSLWDADHSNQNSFRLSDGIAGEHSGSSIAGNNGVQATTPSVWGRIRSGKKLELMTRIDSTVSPSGYLENEVKEDHVESLADTRAGSNQSKHAIAEETGQKTANSVPVPRSRADSGHNTLRASHKALRTLFVNGIPHKNNRRDALFSHFQKFGKVIDIYIPHNSEKAFVQFSKREEAEAALKAPDAVMGNRFIKLWWANRDSIVDEGDSGVQATSQVLQGAAASSVSLQPSGVDRGKESLQPSVLKAGASPVADVSVAVSVPPKTLAVNAPKATPPVQKKQETLDLLEELRKKQELLAQKRSDLWHQLDKFEKQATPVNKSEVISEQALKKQRKDEGSEVNRAATHRPANLGTSGAWQGAEKTVDKICPGESLVSPSSKANSTMPQQSPRGSKQASRLAAPSLNRFKLDNRPTAFRILPPLPADFANVAALRDHFLSFGDATVELENHEANSGSSGLRPSTNFSARITFTTRHSAERAFLSGKCWQGHNLQFSWVTASSSSCNSNSAQEISPSQTPKGDPDAEIQSEPLRSRSSAGISTSSVISEVAATTRGRETRDLAGSHSGQECLPKELAQASLSSLPILSSCEKLSPKSDVPTAEDGINVSFAQ